MALSMTPDGYLPSRHPKRLARERAERLRASEPHIVTRRRYRLSVNDEIVGYCVSAWSPWRILADLRKRYPDAKSLDVTEDWKS